ncbi:MAG: anthranilate synthase component I family protein [Acidobacteria bacterium]|nr:anthranilate synthase component I family protein [Acidobacteriota bacterium]
MHIPDLVLARFDARAVIGPEGAGVVGDGESRAVLELALRGARESPAAPPPPALGGWESSLDRAAFEDRVRAILGHIGAGDCYQVNLARRLTCEREADPVALFGALARENPAPHSALVRLSGIGVVSASPERFLRADGARVETRPIKGTGTDARALATSEKDRAENVMIVDLARNDLGRVCEPGSVRVPALCAVEPHPGLLHLVSTVTGTLRPDAGFADLVRATFPPASITGAPKPRVMQIIEDLEPVRRGVYCGAVGWIDADRGRLDLNVGIRTFVVAGGRTSLGVGAGIVADSDPASEWRETELKSARLLSAAGAERTPGLVTSGARA